MENPPTEQPETLQYATPVWVDQITAAEWAWRSWPTRLLFYLVIGAQLVATVLPLESRARSSVISEAVRVFLDAFDRRGFELALGTLTVCFSLVMSPIYCAILSWSARRRLSEGLSCKPNSNILGWTISGAVFFGLIAYWTIVVMQLGPDYLMLATVSSAALLACGSIAIWIATRGGAPWGIPALMWSTYIGAAVFVILVTERRRPGRVVLIVAAALTLIHLLSMVVRARRKPSEAA